MKIHVFGLGAIGSNLLVQLHKRFPDATFYGIDFDTVEDRNIKTQAYFLEHRGKPKSAVIPTILARKNAKFNYKPINKKLMSQDDLKAVPDIETSDLILDCFDNTAARTLLKNYGKKNILHIGFSPHLTAEIMWNDLYDVPPDIRSTIDICELDSAVGFIHYVVNFAAMQVFDFFDKKQMNNFIITERFKIKRVG
jgi:hypothetical protein